MAEILSTWKDFDINMAKDQSGDLLANTGVAAIYGSLRNIMMTIRGERRMLPEFAYNLYEKLFEPMDDSTANDIANNLVGAIQKWEPRIKLTDVKMITDYDNNTYEVTLVFILIEFGAAGNIYEYTDILRAG